VSAAIVLASSGCGGGGGGGSSIAPPPSTSPAPPPSGFQPGVFPPSSNFKNLCANPRPGAQFPDSQGTTEDENNWLRSWSNELYLWYAEITDRDPANFGTPQYFDLMKTFASTSSGAAKDKFHFIIPTDEWIALSQSGESAAYGSRFSILAASPPREIVVGYTQPGTPASSRGLLRGAQILEADGLDVATTSQVDGLNAALFPSETGETHQFVVRDVGAATTRAITMTSQIITIDSVNVVRVETTPTGLVGYLSFTEQALIDAMETLRAAAVTDLVLDLRYNLGGFLDIANELAYMIAGPAAAGGEVFDEIQFSDKHPTFNPVTGEVLAPDLFHATTQGFGSTPSGLPLPALNLNRVYVLTGSDTCSASEAIINGLRGINVEVNLIGEGTCGKPYGFFPFDNCGTTYFSIQFKGVNVKGFGDYTDGFTPDAQGEQLPGCPVADDFGHALGDPLEARFAAALQYREDTSCTVTTTTAVSSLGINKGGSGEGAVTRRRLPGAIKRMTP
jgi:hypothetical protein